MTDTIETTPGTAPVAPVQAAAVAVTPAGAPDGYIELNRYNGLMVKVQSQVGDISALTGQLATANATIGDLKAQLLLKETETAVTLVARDKQLNDVVTSKSELETELAELRALKLKVKVATDIGHPELVKVFASMPNLTDEAALTTVMTSFTSFGSEMVRAREAQLLGGITPPIGSVTVAPVTPSSHDAWNKVINAAPLGSAERKKLNDEYWTWGQQNPT